MSLHFSVRARALSSLVTPILAVLMNPLFGMILDMKSVGPRKKGMIAFWVWTIPTAYVPSFPTSQHNEIR